MEENSPGRFQKLVESARQSLAQDNDADARKYAELLLNEFPKSEEGWLILASISEPEKALVLLENAMRVNPDSQATRQAIRLITDQILSVNQPVVEIPEVPALEDTQPIAIKEIFSAESDPATEFNDLNVPPSETEPPETFDLEGDEVNSEEIITDVEPAQEEPIENSLVEEFPEVQTDLQVFSEAEKEKVIDEQVLTSLSDSPIAEKKIRIKKKLVKAIEQPETKPDVNKLRKTITDRNPQRKAFDVEIVELLLVASVAVLLPVLVFIFFYFRR